MGRLWSRFLAEVTPGEKGGVKEAVVSNAYMGEERGEIAKKKMYFMK